MAKLTTNTIAGAYASTTELNDNFALVEAAMEKCLFLDGTSPNIMSADIDLNGNDILNVGNIAVTGAAREGTDILSTGETGGTKFLREDGDGTSSWQAVASGAGQWVLLEDRATTAISEIDFTWDDTLYDEIRFECRGICGASGTDRQLKVQVGHTGGTAFYSTSGDYKGTFREFKDLTLTAHTTTTAHLCGQSVLNIDTSYGGMAGTVRIIAGSHDGSGCIIESRTTHAYGGGTGDILAYESKTYIEPIEKAIEIDSARFLWDGGAGVNFKVPGNIRMFGLKNS